MTQETTPDISSPQRTADTEMTPSSSAPALAAHDQHSPLFVIWTEIIESCSNPLHERYPEYGGKGINVCAEWRDFANFQTWARVNGYISGRYLACIDPAGDYAPENCGWSTVPHGLFRPRHRTYNAFGETKSLQEWAEDARCTVSFGTLNSRVRTMKWDVERALSTPAMHWEANPSGYTLTTIPVGAQFGELTVIGACLRTLLHAKTWQYTYPCRCSCGEERSVQGSSLLNGKSSYCGTREHAHILGKAQGTHQGSATRLYRKWHKMRMKVAKEQSTFTAEPGQRAVIICAEWQDFSAFRDWAMAQEGYSDDCAIVRRDPQGDYTPENCVWVETARAKAPRGTHQGSRTRLYEFWEVMRMNVAQKQRLSGTTLSHRVIGICAEWDDFSAFRDWAMAHGYREGLYLSRRDPQGDYTPDNCLWVDAETKSVQINGSRLYTAFGETKYYREWLRDPRCVVSKTVVYRRLREGKPLETALSTPVAKKKPAQAGADYTAFAETKSLSAWARDPRCLVPYASLYSRIHHGWTIEAALTTPLERQGITAFGETKTLEAWQEDSRCRVERNVLGRRLRAGWDAETALITGPQHHHQTLTIFGETKSLVEWANDPRCAVLYMTWTTRLRQGWDAERALTTPPLNENNSKKRKQANSQG